MMSGDENNNGKENAENHENESLNDPAGNEKEVSDSPLLSRESEAKSYPFSIPGAEEETESPDMKDTSGDDAPDARDVLGALDPSQDNSDTEIEPHISEETQGLGHETNQESVPESQEADENLSPLESHKSDETTDEVEEEIEAALDEGLFTNDVLPEEGEETSQPQISDADMGEDRGNEGSERESTDQEERPESEAHPVGVEQEIPAHVAALDAERTHSESPTHAFDMGEADMNEKEFSESVKKKSGFSTLLVSMIILFLLVGVVIGGGFFYVKLKFNAPGSQTQNLTHVIKPKQGLRVIAEDLQKKGIIEDKNIFMLGTYINGENKSLKAGEFEFAPNASMNDVLQTISKGKVIQHKITLAEGLTSQQIVEIINDNPVLTGDIEQLPPEGSLLPETYQFERGMSRQKIIERMQIAQKNLIDKLWPKRDDNIGVVTPADAIVLASIVEKETGLSSERSRVAAVFNNRLLRNMRLQSDPTVIYGIAGGEGKLDRPISRSDLDEKTLYNTYKIDGLPPTPIANPGKAAIEAVLKPAKTNDIYFVADGTGGHAFATSLKEHNENVARWRKIEKGVDAPESMPAEEAKPVVKKSSDVDKEVKEKAPQKTGVMEKTTTLKSNAKTLSEKPKKSDLATPSSKSKVEAHHVEKETTKAKESLTEKVKTIFVKPEEAPLPRTKPNALLKEGIDKINVTPLPEQKVPAAPGVAVPQIVHPGGEPTPELESVTKPAPKKEVFNPFND